MVELNFLTNLIEKIPLVIGIIRNFFIDRLGISEPIYQIIIAAIALLGSYYWMKQWITYSVFYKISTILNWLLLSLLIYTLFVYI